MFHLTPLAELPCVAPVKPCSLCWGSRGFRVWEEMAWDRLSSSSPMQALCTPRLRSGLGQLPCSTYKSNTHSHSPCPSFLWVFCCCHPAPEKNLTTLASDGLSRVWCDSVQSSSDVYTSTVRGWEDSEKSREIAKPRGVSRLEGPWQNRSHAPLKCPTLFLTWMVWSVQNLWGSWGDAQESQQRRVPLTASWQLSARVCRSYPLTEPGIWWPVVITPLIKWGQIFWKWSTGRSTFLFAVQWGVLCPNISDWGGGNGKTYPGAKTMMFKMDCYISPELKLLEDCLVKRPSFPTGNQEEFFSAPHWTESLPKMSFGLSWKQSSSLPCFTEPFWICWELRWLVHHRLCCVRCRLLLFCILLQICFSTDWKNTPIESCSWESFRVDVEKNVVFWFSCK